MDEDQAEKINPTDAAIKAILANLTDFSSEQYEGLAYCDVIGAAEIGRTIDGILLEQINALSSQRAALDSLLSRLKNLSGNPPDSNISIDTQAVIDCTGLEIVNNLLYHLAERIELLVREKKRDTTSDECDNHETEAELSASRVVFLEKFKRFTADLSMHIKLAALQQFAIALIECDEDFFSEEFNAAFDYCLENFEIYFFDPSRLLDLIKNLEQYGFYEIRSSCVEKIKQLSDKFDDLLEEAERNPHLYSSHLEALKEFQHHHRNLMEQLELKSRNTPKRQLEILRGIREAKSAV